MKRLSIIAAGLLALPLLLACEDGPTAPASLQKAPADPPPPGETWTSLEVVPESFTLKVGRTYQLQAMIRASDGVKANAGHLVEWSSSNPAVAAVSRRGRVEGRASGDAQIIALYKGKRALAFVTVIGLPDDDKDFPEPEG